ncbi:type IX secretion system plug protein domain-containing protein [Apibacter sp. HY039]|uniref:type IX secretion system plug protein n=1 Tax=Apibacter sp. HY039 TaxID=2501476 RepID=UPI000FEBB3A0|nr:type IX secretion system plug protein domain-containing protein [Apibacter sp. HY039]
MRKLLINLLFPLALMAQQAEEKVYDKSVNGIQFFNPETNDETTILKLGDKFILSFDMLDKGYERLYYSIRHYDRNWEKDNLFESEYIDGYTQSQIYEYQSSFNTRQNYTHYTLEFPNNDMRPKVSGNYLFTVYDADRKPVFSKKILYYEPQAEVGVKYERYSSAQNPDITQRVIVEASIPSNQGSIRNNQLSLCILQNNNWKVAQCNISPQFINGNLFTFGQLTNAFEGGNEFFTFDTKNITVAGYGVYRVFESEGKYNTWLYPVIPYPLDYTYNPDVNGAFYFRRFDLSQERDARNEGDYTPVSFFVNSTNPIDDKDLYVVGLFNNYDLSESNKMEFNEEQRGYEKTCLLKQGFYNYTIATKDKKSGRISFSEIPGSFWQTENLYQALIYYVPFGGTYDALIGYGEVRATRQ